MVTPRHNSEHNCGLKQCQITQIAMSNFGENADFITIHAGFLPFAQKRTKMGLKNIPKYTIIDIGKFVQRKIIVYYHT